MKDNRVIGVLGFGEVGRSWEKFYGSKSVKVEHRDISEETENFKNSTVVHVSIPMSGTITQEILKLTKDLPYLSMIIIHTTAKVGTTRKISEEIPDHIHIAHCPVRGNHPHLDEGFATFVMYVGAVKPDSADAVSDYLSSLGISTRKTKPEESELAKLLCTTAYGINISFMLHVREICKDMGVDFDVVYSNWTRDYNAGYSKLNRPDVSRPILLPPPSDEKAKIGGHCVVPNSRILSSQFPSFGTVNDLIEKFS